MRFFYFYELFPMNVKMPEEYQKIEEDNNKQLISPSLRKRSFFTADPFAKGKTTATTA